MKIAVYAIAKSEQINVPSWSERDGDDWNIACNGVMIIDRQTSTAVITPGD